MTMQLNTAELNTAELNESLPLEVDAMSADRTIDLTEVRRPGADNADLGLFGHLDEPERMRVIIRVLCGLVALEAEPSLTLLPGGREALPQRDLADTDELIEILGFAPWPEPVAETPAPAFAPWPDPVAATPAPAFAPWPEPVAPEPAATEPVAERKRLLPYLGLQRPF